MRLESKELAEEVEIDMSPMIDMVFLLLIFFIVASQIVSDKPPVEVPTAESAAIGDAVDEERFMISVSKAEDPLEKYYLPFDPHNAVPWEQVVSAVTAAVNANPEVKIVVRADNLVPFKETEKLMKACAEAGAYNMIFAAYEEND